MTEDHLCYVLEHLIGAMTGRELADPYTVEMYIRKVEAFYMAFIKIEVSEFPDSKKTSVSSLVSI